MDETTRPAMRSTTPLDNSTMTAAAAVLLGERNVPRPGQGSAFHNLRGIPMRPTPLAHGTPAPLSRRLSARLDTIPAGGETATWRRPIRSAHAEMSFDLVHEERRCTGRRRLRPREIAALGFDPYGQQVLLLFDVHRQVHHCPVDPDEESVLGALAPGLRRLVAHRWPKHMPDAGAPS
ncbi:hypothetical protein ACIRD0_02050 [Streptomyces microflavus]|uniref:hypothetical protein n=1 Tax=Streptomyces microflavus TaxID=1919 RepID=UPI0037F2BE2B